MFFIPIIFGKYMGLFVGILPINVLFRLSKFILLSEMYTFVTNYKGFLTKNNLNLVASFGRDYDEGRFSHTNTHTSLSLTHTLTYAHTQKEKEYVLFSALYIG